MDITNLQNQVTLVEDDLARATTPADFRRLSTLIDETTELTIQQIRNYSNAGGIADKRKLETILNRCKYLDARIKQSLIKTGEGVSGGSDESSVTYYDVSFSCFLLNILILIVYILHVLAGISVQRAY